VKPNAILARYHEEQKAASKNTSFRKKVFVFRDRRKLRAY